MLRFSCVVGLVSRTAYKWLARYAQAGTDGLQDQRKETR